MKALLETRDLEIRIAGHAVCQGLHLQVHRGESWALLGPNGAGKTTLLHGLAGLHASSRGSVLLDGDPIGRLKPRERARRVALLLQHSSTGFGGTALDAVLSGRHPHLSAFAWEGPGDLEIARRAMQELALTGVAGRSLETLSGGELRRVEIARLLAQQCPLTLLDEPLNHLDLTQQTLCLNVLTSRSVTPERGMLMVVHDLNIAYRACRHWLLLDGAGGWYAGPREQMSDCALLSRVFRHPIERIDTARGPLFMPEHALADD